MKSKTAYCAAVCIVLFSFGLVHAQQKAENFSILHSLSFESALIYKQSIPNHSCSDTKITVRADNVVLALSKDSSCFEGEGVLSHTVFEKGFCDKDIAKAAKWYDGIAYFKVTFSNDSTITVYFEPRTIPQEEWAEQIGGKSQQSVRAPLWKSFYDFAESSFRSDDGFEFGGFKCTRIPGQLVFTGSIKRVSEETLSKTTDLTKIVVTFSSGAIALHTSANAPLPSGH
jgi:hypothetical protein